MDFIMYEVIGRRADWKESGLEGERIGRRADWKESGLEGESVWSA